VPAITLGRVTMLVLAGLTACLVGACSDREGPGFLLEDARGVLYLRLEGNGGAISGNYNSLFLREQDPFTPDQREGSLEGNLDERGNLNLGLSVLGEGQTWVGSEDGGVLRLVGRDADGRFITWTLRAATPEEYEEARQAFAARARLLDPAARQASIGRALALGLESLRRDARLAAGMPLCDAGGEQLAAALSRMRRDALEFDAVFLEDVLTLHPGTSMPLRHLVGALMAAHLHSAEAGFRSPRPCPDDGGLRGD
jgi:hypothetical protein